MGRSKSLHSGGRALLGLNLSGFKRPDALCGVFVIFSLVAAGFLVSSWSPGDVFLPVLGTNLITSTMHVEQQAGSSEEQEVVPVIERVVVLPEEVLFLVRTPLEFRLPEEATRRLRCHIGSSVVEVQGIDETEFQRSVVRCNLIPKTSLEVVVVVALNDTDSGLVVPSKEVQVLTWNFLAFEAVVTSQDVVLFAKGLVTRRGHHRRVDDIRCVFDGRVETRVTSAAQEVFRCAHPPPGVKKGAGSLVGKTVTLSVQGRLMPTAASYYDQPGLVEREPEAKYFICSCTMVFNVAKFLKEWVTYHAKLGVERFYFYDNNSEDNIKEVLEQLEKFNVSRHIWPWLKSQEAGFSHCALRAQSECTWMLYTDVDEFIFPNAWLRKSPRPLAQMVREMSACKRCQSVRSLWNPWRKMARKQVGQIFLGCRVFGPSGLKKHPAAGVTVGYVCRAKKLQRHKSIVLLEAVNFSLLNVVHHFQLKPEYVNSSVSSWKGIIEHYKYQVWDEFKSKFRRRVSAYVSDWKQAKNLDSNDRTPGLGTQEVEPPNWSLRFCEVNDTDLRSYVSKTFYDRRRRKMVWQ